ncbi:MAG: DUF58 domain-containing protein [Planctomycetota bacterium]
MAPSPTHPEPPSSASAAAQTASEQAQLYLHPKTLARLGSFELRAKLIVEGVMSGMHRSPYQGVSVEFAQHRPYVAGDDLRHLDWKVFARTDRLQIKQYQQETNLDLVIMVDSSGSMGFGSNAFAKASGAGVKESPGGGDRWRKFDHATGIAAALSYITLQQGDRAGLAVYADELRAIVDRSSQRSSWRKIVAALSTHVVDRETNLMRALEQALGKVTNRCLFLVMSDFYEDAERVKAALARLRHRGHDAIIFQIVDPAEEAFDFDEPMPFEGMEGEPLVRVNPRAIRDAYLEAFEDHAAQIKRAALGLGFDYQLVRAGDWLGPTLASFVSLRNAKIRKSRSS